MFIGFFFMRKERNKTDAYFKQQLNTNSNDQTLQIE